MAREQGGAPDDCGFGGVEGGLKCPFQAGEIGNLGASGKRLRERKEIRQVH